MKENIILAVDTTSSPLLVCLKKGKNKAISIKKNGVKQEEYLFPAIKKALAKENISLKDVTKVFYVRGPGRFTGIRIGLTLAGMLRGLTGAEACSATMFEVLYLQTQNSKEFKTWIKNNLGGKAAVVLHAFREEYFLQIFDGSEPRWFDKEEMFAFMASYNAPLFVTGFDKEKTSLNEMFAGAKYTLGSAKLCSVNKNSLINMALITGFEKNTLEPLYLKPARFELGK
ncbi:Glycoprotease family protein [Elusimicrobium minutum Pei191]|uniref:Glycoprotease family protein n=1 Tax=Elusimicrobium minutum (strain Pei191) TaxID=445932 RepID=B2KDW2_ELUMP|nr:tRNA (adenosine(37)-N6)-threonylcarbamoyltransferase complex dimerization subunit type 1 TsaB [Elusimicrobium minutum]ACC98708.1 Glycoprotease family protein [Elusimicrobium minutum Pei191]